MNAKSIFNKEIQIKTNLLTILIVCTLLFVPAVFFLTNGVQNLMFATISVEQVDTITVNAQTGERNATLSQTDVEALVPLLRKVRLVGRSVRLYETEVRNPQYTVQLKSGKCFDIACDKGYRTGYYIVNGRGYIVKDSHDNNRMAINELYHDFLANREYFPRESR